MAPPSGDLLDLLGADLNRRILALTSEEPRATEAVADRCEASLPTIYRHVDDLASAGLLTERTQFDDEGNHYKTYAAALDELRVRVDDGDLVVEAEVDDNDEPEYAIDTPTPAGINDSGTDSADEVEGSGAEE